MPSQPACFHRLDEIFTALRALPAFSAAETLPCADRSVTASAVRSPEGVEAFVQCAYEFVQEVGFETARRAFHEDERWRNGPVYVVVTEVAQMLEMARAFVFPPDPSSEGSPWGPLIDVFGSDYSEELHRIVNSFGAGAGVASSGGTGLGEGPSIGGQRPRNNNFMVEGVDNNDKGVTGRVVNVPNEAVAEWALSSVRAVPSNITRNNLIPAHPVFNRPDQVYDSHAREIHLVLRFTF